MKNCTNCNIKFNTEDKYCPLCQNKLQGKNEHKIFPPNIRLKTNTLLLKLLIYMSLVICIISGFIEIYITSHIYYSFFVMGLLLTNYIMVYFTLKNKKNCLDLFGKYGLILIIIAFIWYLFTKKTFITNYIIPLFSIIELIFNLVSFIILKKLYIVNYLKYILLNIILLILPAILIIFKCTSYNLPSYICVLLALIVLLGLIVFFFDEIKTELKKIFNI